MKMVNKMFSMSDYYDNLIETMRPIIAEKFGFSSVSRSKVLELALKLLSENLEVKG